MNNIDYLEEIVRRKNELHPPGVFSVCSANPFVLDAVMRSAREHGYPLLVETTCNQVNQYGGYTGMTPQAFTTYVLNMAAENNLTPDMILLGGDHLGPFAWKNEPAEAAMQKSVDLVRHYIHAGYQKIHLDASMPCQDDTLPLPHEVIAEREAWLCRAAVDEIAALGRNLASLVFVLGTEVPAAGGALQDQEGIIVSSVEQTRENIEYTRKLFFVNNLEAAWDRTVAFVVQPGVEFSNTHVHPYDSQKARPLTRLIEQYDGLVYEAHSTDYQTRAALRHLVTDHFAFLKVGPALTFALREALFSLCDIETELFGDSETSLSELKKALECVMLANPEHWRRYYTGDEHAKAFKRKYSLLDRSRYYFSHPDMEKAVKLLIQNLAQKSIPLTLVSQYLPDQVGKVIEGRLRNDPRELILGKIADVVDDYLYACSLIDR